MGTTTTEVSSAAAVAGVIAGVSVTAVGGADAPAFLHGQLANDVTGLAVGAAGRSLYLNHRGHAMAEVMVLRRDRQAFHLVEEGGAAAWVKAELERHIVFDEVTLAAPVAASLVTLQGPGAAEVLASLGVGVPALGQTTVADVAGVGKVSVWSRHRSAAGGYDLLLDQASGSGADAILAALEKAGARPVTSDDLDLLRVRALAAVAPQDAGEGVLPQEAGLEAALSYRKGCYLGQEIMARIEARGNLRRGLSRVRLTRDPRMLTPGGSDWRELRSGGRVVGRLGTVAPDGEEFEALAVVRQDLPDGAELVAGGEVAAALVGV